MADLSHIMLIEISKDYGSFVSEEVILFNEAHISEQEALSCAKADAYHKDVLCIPKPARTTTACPPSWRTRRMPRLERRMEHG